MERRKIVRLLPALLALPAVAAAPKPQPNNNYITYAEFSRAVDETIAAFRGT